MMIVPSSALDSMNIGALSGLAGMGMNSVHAQQQAADKAG